MPLEGREAVRERAQQRVAPALARALDLDPAELDGVEPVGPRAERLGQQLAAEAIASVGTSAATRSRSSRRSGSSQVCWSSWSGWTMPPSAYTAP
jgi:hypothetical protein